MAAAPTKLTLSDLAVTDPPVIAGTRAGVRLTVSNPTPFTSAKMPITVTLTGGITLYYVDGLGLIPGFCGPLYERACTLPAIAADGSQRLEFFLAVPLSTRSGSITVTIDGTTRSSTFDVRALIGNDSVPQELPTVRPTAPPSTTVPTTTAPTTAAPTSTAPITTTPTSDAPETTASTITEPTDTTATPETSTSEPATTGPESSTDPTPVTAGSTETPSSTDITTRNDPQPSTRDGGPTGTSLPSTGSSASTSPDPVSQDAEPSTTMPTREPDPAAVVLSQPEGGAALAAGGAATLRLTAGNVGGQRSAGTPLQLTLPTGVVVTAVSMDGAVICQDGRDCVLPPLEAGQTASVVLTLAIGGDAGSGGALLTADGSGVGWQLRIGRPGG